jgi:hypothetical protein
MRLNPAKASAIRNSALHLESPQPPAPAAVEFVAALFMAFSLSAASFKAFSLLNLLRATLYPVNNSGFIRTE